MGRPLKKRSPRTQFYLAMATVVLILLAIVVLAGCERFSKPDPAPKVIESHQPVLVRPEPPPEIVQRYQPFALPDWVSPDHPDASSCLKREGEDQIRRNMIEEQELRQKSRIYATGGLL